MAGSLYFVHCVQKLLGYKIFCHLRAMITEFQRKPYLSFENTNVFINDTFEHNV